MTSTIEREAPVSAARPSETSTARGRRRAPGPHGPSSSRMARTVRGPAADPTWARPALLALLATTALLYLWGLGASGWANSFYSAAVQAGTHSWKAFFFGSSDAANSITVDKPPVALWVMGISARLFGTNAWSILVPQALAGVASVSVLYATVKRWFGPGAALLAGAVLATTPVATLMFRFNNPDAMLVLLLVGAVYALVRALETTSTKWLVLAWSLVGFGFLTKMLQALLVAPAFALVYLVCAPTKLRRRLVQSVWGFLALIVSAGWWVAIVSVWPASSRPFIGGSQTNSIMELIVGYNGFGRLTGNETGSVGGGGGNGGNWGATGWDRMFNRDFGSQVAWLLPAALLLLVAGLFLRGRVRRTDRARAALLIWGGWLVTTLAAFSFGAGIIHAYYTVALAPAIGALVGIGLVPWWHRRHEPAGRVVLATTVAVTTTLAYALMHRTPSWAPLLQSVILIGGLLAAAALAFAPSLRGKAGTALAACALALALAGPAAYSLQTASTPHTGSIVTAGPGTSGMGGPGGAGGTRRAALGGLGTATSATGGTTTGAAAGTTTAANASVGGLLQGSTSTPELTTLLRTDASQYRWAAAAIGSNSASGYQLAADEPVMAIGGFNGTDPSPTLAQFKAYVAAGDIHYFIAGGGQMGGQGGTTSSSSSAITSWVTAHYTATTVDGVTIYDLTT